MSTYLRSFCCSAILFVGVVFAFNGGDGTLFDPYQITAVEHLEAVNQELDACYILLNDIDLEGFIYERALIAYNTGTGDSFAGSAFTGVFDGDGFAILNLTIQAQSNNYIGLFGLIGEDATVLNLGVEQCDISGSSYVGGLCGSNDCGWLGEINNCYVSGTVSGVGNYIGGLAGICEEDSYTINSHSLASVTGVNYVGGLVGLNNWYCETNSSYSAGEVTGVSYVGGLVGQNYGSYIRNSYSDSVVIGSGDYVGGLTGFNDTDADIDGCFSKNTVNGSNYVGGLVGANDGAFISNSYSFAAASGNSRVGGLVGHNFYGYIDNCYSAGAVLGSGDYVAGLIGMSQGEAIGCFWDKESSGLSVGGAGKGLTTEQMKDSIYYRRMSWSGDDWVMQNQIDYPRLSWEDSLGEPLIVTDDIGLQGQGTLDNPYQIFTAEDFAMLSWWDIKDKNFILMADIDLAEMSVYSIEKFRATFEGNAYKIFNINIYQPLAAHTGVFGILDEGAVIKNLAIEGCRVEGFFRVGGLAGKNETGATIDHCSVKGTVIANDNSSGAIAGHNNGEITDCFTQAQVTGYQKSTGGVVGYNSGGLVERCFSISDVTGYLERVGGLVGWSNGTVRNCYAHGTANGDTKVAGLVGVNYQGQIVNCYSTTTVTGNDLLGGLVATINSQGDYEDTANFWDTQTSLMQDSAMGDGITTSQMQTQTTFTNVGWDFIDIWQMPQDSYPIFRAKQYLPDINVDGLVDLADLELFAQNWLLNGCREPYWCGGADFNADGKVCSLDFATFADSWTGETDLLVENFESGDFSKFEWQHSGNIYWTVVSDMSYQGSYAAKSGAISHGQISSLEITVKSDVETISFYINVSSERNYDFFRFYINGVEKGKWSGTTGWSKKYFSITPGTNTFKWSYSKDGSVSVDSDCAWLDNIEMY